MNRPSKLVVGVAAFLGGCVATQVTRIGTAQATVGAAKREYKEVTAVMRVSEDDPNQLAAQGWELDQCPNQNVCFVRRPRG